MWMLRCRARFIFFPLPFHKFRHCYFALHLFLCVATFTLHLMDLFDQFLLELDQISSLHLRTSTLTFLIIVLHFPGSFLPHFTNLLISNILDFGLATQSTLVQSWHPWVESWKSVPQIKYEVGFLFLYFFHMFPSLSWSHWRILFLYTTNIR